MKLVPFYCNARLVDHRRLTTRKCSQSEENKEERMSSHYRMTTPLLLREVGPRIDSFIYLICSKKFSISFNSIIRSSVLSQYLLKIERPRLAICRASFACLLKESLILIRKNNIIGLRIEIQLRQF